MPYVLGEDAAVFQKIEAQLIEEDLTTLVADCTTIIDNSTSSKEKGIAFFYIGQVAALGSNFSLAEEAYQDAMGYFQAISFKKGLALLLYKRGELQFIQGNYELANNYLQKAVRLAEQQQLPLVLIDAYQIKANIYAATQQSDSTSIVLKKGLSIAIAISDKEASKNILNQLATNYHAAGQLDTAIYYFRQLLEVKKSIKDVEGLISDYTALGNLYRERGSYELAQQQYIAGLWLAESTQDSFALMMFYAEIGKLYETQKVNHLAVSNYKKSLAIAAAKENDFLIAACCKQLGNLSFLANDKTQAINYYQKALGLYKQLGNKINAADIQIQLSACYQNDTQFPEAKALLQEAIVIRQDSRDLLSTLKAKMSLGKLELLYGNQQAGIQLLQACISDYESMQDQEGLSKAYLLLANSYERNQQHQLALQFYQQHYHLQDSLTAIEKTKVINELAMQYNTEKKDKEILEQSLALEQQQTEIQQRKNQLFLLGSGFLLTCLLLALLLFINQKNKQLNQQKIQVLKKEQEAQQLKTLIEGEEKERKRIGRDLHDGLGAVLAAIKMQINNIPIQSPTVSNSLSYQKSEQLIDEACQTVREISHGMMPYILEQEGLAAALEDMCQTISSTKDLTIYFNPYQVELIKSDTLKITLYRITQELLKNILTHANATEVIVQLTVEDNQIELLVEDDGKGFDPTIAKKGIGLANIQSRVQYLNGVVEIDSQIDRGTTFSIHIPLAE